MAPALQANSLPWIEPMAPALQANSLPLNHPGSTMNGKLLILSTNFKL